ncbi:hypothetical protein BCR32DRAFT_178932, partial [Anaeromyces robustus]
ETTDDSNKKIKVEEKKPETKKPKRKKVFQACVVCRKSHISCDNKRPCTRCVKKGIAHLCHDAPKKGSNMMDCNSSMRNQQDIQTPHPSPSPQQLTPPLTTPLTPLHTLTPDINNTSLASAFPIAPPSNPQSIPLTTNVASSTVTPIQQQTPPIQQASSLPSSLISPINTASVGSPAIQNPLVTLQQVLQTNPTSIVTSPNILNIPSQQSTITTQKQEIPSSTSSSIITSTLSDIRTEQFFLKAADNSHPNTSIEEQLVDIIKEKYKAGLLKPYNYSKGYLRLQKYLDENISIVNKQKILNAFNTFQKGFKNAATNITDWDLLSSEESFERLLLEYDRVFASVGIPSCLWRRTGEIFKANRHFAYLVGVPIEELNSGKMSIYEFMTEDFVANYWEKYSLIAFDNKQKAVITSCVLENPQSFKRSIKCAFSFTVRRDKFEIPSAIIGNFMPYNP